MKSIILMSGSCHLDRASNVEIGVECQIFRIVRFLIEPSFTILGTFKGRLSQKRSFLVICTTFRSAFHNGWKKSKQTFNTKFVIQRSVQMA